MKRYEEEFRAGGGDTDGTGLLAEGGEVVESFGLSSAVALQPSPPVAQSSDIALWIARRSCLPWWMKTKPDRRCGAFCVELFVPVYR